MATGNDDLCCDTIERPIIDDGCGNRFDLRLQLTASVLTWNDDPRCDVSKFAGDRLSEQWLLISFSLISLVGVAAPHDRFVAFGRTSDVDRLSLRVMNCVATNAAISVDDSQPASIQ